MWGSLAHWIVDTLPALALVTVRVKIIDFKTVTDLTLFTSNFFSYLRIVSLSLFPHDP